MLSRFQELARRVVLIAIPVPVIAGSMMLSSWAHHDPNACARRNQVYVSELPRQSASCRPRQDIDAALAVRCEQKAQRQLSRLSDGIVGQPAECHAVVNAPYVIAGNLEPVELQRIYERTVLPAAGAMHGEYFDARPTQPVTILLFADEATYRGYAEALFGQSRVSIYGYYKPSLRTVVINLAAGEGTVVHELTHALIGFDCPELPIWMNEGMASLHEECCLEQTPAGFRIRPLVNWRLAILQHAITRQTMRPTHELMMLERLGGDDEALNYAHARYFCMYLNEMGLLDDLYRLVRSDPDDGSGSRALRSLLSELSSYGLDEDFQRWVMQLRLDG